jgi:hypothetical protein
MGSSEVSSALRVPHTALGRYVKLKSNPANGQLKLCKKQVLHPSLKEDVVEHCLNMEKCFFGLAVNYGRRLAYQLAQGNNK